MEGGTIQLSEVIAPPKRKPSTSLNSRADRKITKDAPGDESYEYYEASDAPMSFKIAATPKGKKAAVDRAKAAVEEYQQSIAIRGRSALAAVTAKMKSTPIAETATREKGPASMRRVTPKPNGVAGHEQKTGPVAVKASEFDGQDKLSVTRKVTLEMKDASGNGKQSSPVRVKKVSGLTKESSALAIDGQERAKAFRGNQYLNADRTPRPDEGGMPRTKERPTPGQ
jgi:hypothetical protein